MGVCVHLNAAVLGIAATIYLVLGIALIAASAATFFTPYGRIFGPIYAASGIGAGVLIFLISVIGYLAACRKKSCWLGLYMLFDLLIIVLIIIAVALMFRYEDVLNLATEAKVDGQVESGLAALSDLETNLVKDVVTNAFNACNGTAVVKSAVNETFDFKCGDTYFNQLGDTVDMCVASGVNATAGSLMYSCYTSTKWVSKNKAGEEVKLVAPYQTPQVLPVLQTPKGLYCACAVMITNDFILRYITAAKWIGIGVAVFFILIFVSCCYLCCCAPKENKDNGQGHVEFTPNSWSAGGQNSNVGYSSKQKGYGKSGKYGEGAFVARP